MHVPHCVGEAPFPTQLQGPVMKDDDFFHTDPFMRLSFWASCSYELNSYKCSVFSEPM